MASVRRDYRQPGVRPPLPRRLSNSSGYPATGEDFDRSLFLGEPDINYLDTDRDTLTLKAEHDFGGGLRFGSTARYNKGTGGFGFIFLASVTSKEDTTVSRDHFANDADFENFVAGAHLHYETSLGAVQSRTIAGVDYRDNERDPGRLGAAERFLKREWRSRRGRGAGGVGNRGRWATGAEAAVALCGSSG